MAAHNLPAHCAFGHHVPVIVSRSGGKDPRDFNTCGKCGRQIERLPPDGDGGWQWWGTSEQVAAVEVEERAEHEHELSADEYEAMHPEARCPTRE